MPHAHVTALCVDAELLSIGFSHYGHPNFVLAPLHAGFRCKNTDWMVVDLFLLLWP